MHSERDSVSSKKWKACVVEYLVPSFRLRKVQVCASVLGSHGLHGERRGQAGCRAIQNDRQEPSGRRREGCEGGETALVRYVFSPNEWKAECLM